jgi:CubicO group peptidase (beta-lactamase class C family)
VHTYGVKQVAELITRAIATHAFPACVIEVGCRSDIVWREAFGRLTYAPDAPQTREDTIFDLASLTKVIATTTLMMLAVDERRIALEDLVAGRVPEWRGADRARVTVRDLLEHTSGLTAYLPFFRDHHGRDEFERAIGTLPLEYAPRTQSIYSDLGFMLLAFMLEDAYQTPFAKLFDIFWAGLRTCPASTLLFNLPRELRERSAPTELDLWRGRLLQGDVHDENTWEVGGAAGHAGLFGTASAVGCFARAVLEGLNGGSSLARPETLAQFVQRSRVASSSRALGWDTMLPTSSCGTRMSPSAIGHTGFTGTSLWIDPARDLYVVLLTNRVHPTRDNNQIQAVRRRVHDEVVEQTADSRLSS